MERPGWAPAEVDIDQPAASRIYDFFLGGAHNFAVDREVAARAVAHMPELPRVLRQGRSLLRRMVRFLAAEAGIRQFLDLGSGIPTVGNVHEIAQRIDPICRVAYVDIDPVAVAHSRAILRGNRYATAVQGDVRRPLCILAQPQVRALLALDRPIAVLLIAVLHFLPDADDPAGIVGQLRRAVAPGSYLAIAHSSDEGTPPQGMDRARQVYARSDNEIITRSKAQIEALFSSWDLVPPGVVRAPLWRPDPGEQPPSDAAAFPGFAGVAHTS